jgi:hypothetical protein
MRLPRSFSIASFLLLVSSTALSQETYKVEVWKEPPPAALSSAVRGVLETEGYRVLDGKGNPFVEIWLRKGVPASEKPSAPKGPVQFPFLSEGELLGALKFSAEGHDFRDQTIAKGIYTLRYGLQPQNGDHNGTSEFRDFALLLPAGKDSALAAIPKKPLEERSAESAGTSHPAVFMLLTPPSNPNSSGGPSMTRDEQKDTWGVVVPMKLEVKGASGATPFSIQLIVIGAAMV